MVVEDVHRGGAVRKKGKKVKEKKRKRHSGVADTVETVGEGGESVAKPRLKKVRVEGRPWHQHHHKQHHTDVTIPRNLATVTTNPFKEVTARLYLPISPLYSLYPWLSLECDHLDPLVLTYYPPLRGVIFAYRNIRFNQKGAKMQADSPFAFTWVTVDFLLWCPKKGDRLEGWVNLQSESHVGLLVLNTFNISVPRGKIPQGWRWCEKRVGFVGRKVGKVVRSWDGEEAEVLEEQVEEEEEDLGGWVDEGGKYVDGLLWLTVESVKASGHIITIEGNLLQNEDDIGQANSVSHVRSIDMALPAALPPIPPPPIRGGEGGGAGLKLPSRLGEMEGKEGGWKKEKKDRKEGKEREKGGRKKKEKKERKEGVERGQGQGQAE